MMIRPLVMDDGVVADSSAALSPGRAEPPLAPAPRGEGFAVVYGALRSGTTLLHLMFDGHPQIANPGEMDFLVDHLIEDPQAPGGWRYDVQALHDDRIFRIYDLAIPPQARGLELLDAFLQQIAARTPHKVVLLNIHRHAERLMKVMPGLRLIHLVRDPRDVAASSVQMGWAATLYHGVNHWIESEAAWDRVAPTLRRERVAELSYESLIRAPEQELGRICGLVGLGYDPAMMSYPSRSNYTAPDLRLIEQWKRKGKPAALALVESRAGTLMRRRGYTPVQRPVTVGRVRKIRLKAADVSGRMRFGLGRYGADFLLEKLARWARMTDAHRRVRLRMQQVETLHLK